MLSVQYKAIQYDNNIKEIDNQEGFGFGREKCINPNFERIVGNDPQRIQVVMKLHGVNLTLEECVGMYHAWSQSKRHAEWMTTINEMTDHELYLLMSKWLVELATDNINRLTDVVNEVFKSRL